MAKLTSALLLCAGATENSDGTFTVFRGGLTFWKLEKLPAGIGFTLVVRLPRMPQAVYQSQIKVFDPDGEQILLAAQEVRVMTTEVPVFTIAPLQFGVAKYGNYSLVVETGAARGEERFDILDPSVKRATN